jgi:AraC family L-rhamnose operon transcriptional activator RhaR
MRYLERLRARRAATLLSATDSTVAAVGAAVGWPDPAHFSRRFRVVFGASPRAYRQRLSR